jgi:membrane AbrB-like protein
VPEQGAPQPPPTVLATLRRHLSAADLRMALITLAIAAVGGGLFQLIGMPAAWLSGAMIATAAASLAGVRTGVPDPLRIVIMMFLGASLGAGVSPATLAHLGDWPWSMVALVVALIVLHGGVQLFLVRIGGWDRETAFFSAIPGVLSYVLALAAATRADMRRVAMAQSIRLLLLVALAPSLLSALEPAGSAASQPPVGAASLGSVLLTLAVGAGGTLLFAMLRLAAAPLLGSMAASALLHLTGLASGAFPPVLLVIGYLGIGSVAGSRFSGTDIRLVRSIALVSVGAFFVAAAISAAAAAAVALGLGIPFGQVALAFAPGGLDVMTALAFALQLDSAFVAVHQFARFVIIAIAAPILARPMIGRGKH